MPPEISGFLQTKTEGDGRRTFWKELNPFFEHAKMSGWISENPLAKLVQPDWSKARRLIYTPPQYAKLLETAETNDEYVLRFLVLAGAGFVRVQELLKTSKAKEVLQWGRYPTEY